MNCPECESGSLENAGVGPERVLCDFCGSEYDLTPLFNSGPAEVLNEDEEESQEVPDKELDINF